MDVEDLVSKIEEYGETGKEIDVELLYDSVTNIQSITNLILGLCVGLLLIGFTFVIVLEVIYLSFPAFKGIIDNMKLKFNNHPRLSGFILRDADRAYKKFIESEGTKTALGCYMSIKLKSIILVAFISSMLIMGGPVIVKIVTNILSGFKGIEVAT